MGNLYSRKKKSSAHKVTDQDRAVLDLKNSRDRLTRYQKRLDLECGKLQVQALGMVKAGRKDRALLLLKVKKLKQDQADKASSQLLTVHQLMETIDWESQQLKVFNALKEGNLALQQLHEEMPLEKVEELMADTAENIAMEEEISKAIGGSWTEANEDDLLAELAVLEKEELGEQNTAAAVPPAAAAAAAAAAAIPAAAAAAAAPAVVPAAAPAPAAPATATNKPVLQDAGQSLEEMLPEAPTGPVAVSVPDITAAVEKEEEERVLVPA
eukprot:jgi/Undpi1/7960/HiC_scaffold_24.g10432.m1